MADNKRTFNADGTDYAVVRPNAKQNESAAMEYNRVFSLALKNGALLRESLDKHMRDQNLWDDDREQTYVSLLDAINQKEKSLSKGGIKLSQAKDTALEMRGSRAALQALIAQRNSLDVNTAQGQAENSRFNYLLVECLVYNDTGDPVFEDVDDYSQASQDGAKVSILGAETFANMYFGLDKNYEKNLPENKFLGKFKFTDSEGRLIDSDGNLVDYDGKKIDEEGRYIDEDGSLINYSGEPVTADGEYAFQTQPFLDDEGKPVYSDEEKAAMKKAEEEAEAKKKAEAEEKANKKENDSKPKKQESEKSQPKTDAKKEQKSTEEGASQKEQKNN
jgi:hypothetical protein